MVNNTPRPLFTPQKDQVPILQVGGWGPGPIWTGRTSRPHRDSIPDRPARSQSLYWLSYPVDCSAGSNKKFRINGLGSRCWRRCIHTGIHVGYIPDTHGGWQSKSFTKMWRPSQWDLCSCRAERIQQQNSGYQPRQRWAKNNVLDSLKTTDHK